MVWITWWLSQKMTVLTSCLAVCFLWNDTITDKRAAGHWWRREKMWCSNLCFSFRLLCREDGMQALGEESERERANSQSSMFSQWERRASAQYSIVCTKCWLSFFHVCVPEFNPAFFYQRKGHVVWDWKLCWRRKKHRDRATSIRGHRHPTGR